MLEKLKGLFKRKKKQKDKTEQATDVFNMDRGSAYILGQMSNELDALDNKSQDIKKAVAPITTIENKLDRISNETLERIENKLEEIPDKQTLKSMQKNQTSEIKEEINSLEGYKKELEEKKEQGHKIKQEAGTKLKIIEYLEEHEPATVKDIMKYLDYSSKSTLKQRHLIPLKNKGKVREVRKGQRGMKYYGIDPSLKQ